MRMKMIGITAAALAVAAGAAWAGADGWTPYASTEHGFTVDKPDAMIMTSSTEQAAGGVARELDGALDLPDGGTVRLSVVNHEGWAPDPGPETLLPMLTKGVARVDKGGVLDSSTPITVDGAPGVEIVAHGAGYISRARVVLAKQRLFMILAATGPDHPIPAEYFRLENSLKLTR